MTSPAHPRRRAGDVAPSLLCAASPGYARSGSTRRAPWWPGGAAGLLLAGLTPVPVGVGTVLSRAGEQPIVLAQKASACAPRDRLVVHLAINGADDDLAVVHWAAAVADEEYAAAPAGLRPGPASRAPRHHH